MLTRDAYIAILEKRAADEQAAVDSAEVASDEVASNRDDNRAYLKGLFEQAGAVEKGQSKQIGKLFPGNEDKVSGNVFLKVARQMFDEAFGQVEDGHIKTASPHYREVAFHAFVNELEKIAGPSTTMHQAFLNRNAGAAPKVFHIGEGGGGGLGGAMSAAKKAITPGSAEYGKLPLDQRLAISRQQKPGLLGRAMGALGFGK